MKIRKKDFISKYLTILSLTISVGCNQNIDYDALFNNYADIGLHCASLLDINGEHMLFGEKFTGECLVFDDDLKVKIRLDSYLDGKLEGIILGFYPSGEKEFIGYRKNGEINGKFIRFHKNGEIEISGQFNNGLYSGVFKYFNERGEITEETSFNKSGEIIKSKTF